jgi:2-polyprenyl-6-methoxyphenol hydroxylase-like FAD-dependent oxidoreductase
MGFADPYFPCYLDRHPFTDFSLLVLTPGPKITDPNLVKEEALRIVKNGWPEKMQELIRNTPVESLVRSGIADRWNIPFVTPPLVGKGVALSGDAMHPMTPSLGQGGGTAIEDGVVLAQTLGLALTEGGDDERIQKALEEYAALRQKRTSAITLRSFVIGAVFGIEFPPIAQIRNNVVLPKLVAPSSFLGHTLFDVGKLPTVKAGSNVSAK